MNYSETDFEKIIKHTLSDMILQVNTYFWGSLSVYFGLKVVSRPDIPAIAFTDYKNIFFNIEYINSHNYDLNKDEWCFVIMHELLHIILGHDFRREDHISELWNYACDYVINGLIIKEKIGKKPETALYNKDYDGLSAEQVYNKLKRKYSKFLDNLEQLIQQLQDGEGERIDAHGEGQLTDIEEANIKTIISNHIKNFTPTGGELVKRIVDKITPEPIDFRLFLRNYMKPYLKNEYTWSRPFKKGLTHGYYMPSYKVNHRLVVNIGIDTSGSIEETELKKFLGAFMSLIGQFPRFLVRLWFFSTQVHEENIYELTEKDNRFKFVEKILSKGVPSFGGTMIESNFQYIVKNDLDSDVFICMTDGIDNIENLKYDGNVLWAIVNNKAFKNPTGCKYGKVMFIEGDKR